MAACALLAASLLAAAGAAQAAPVSYICDQGVSFDAIRSDDNKTLVLVFPGGQRVALTPATGRRSRGRYVAEGYSYQRQGDRARFVQPNKPEVNCREIPRVADEPEEPPADQASGPSFDCEGDLAPVEQRICADPSLAELDRRMAKAHKGLLRKLRGAERRRFKKGHGVWLAERDRCGAEDGCIEDQYFGRLAYLEDYADLGEPVPVVTTPTVAPPQIAAPPAEPAEPLASAEPATAGPPAPEPTASPPAPPSPPPAAAFPASAQSRGGNVRAGPGSRHRKLAVLKKDEPITILERSETLFRGQPWFKIEYRGRTGYQWGGLICAKGTPVPGTNAQCN